MQPTNSLVGKSQFKSINSLGVSYGVLIPDSNYWTCYANPELSINIGAPNKKGSLRHTGHLEASEMGLQLSSNIVLCIERSSPYLGH
jgi:hypothetical protein